MSIEGGICIIAGEASGDEQAALVVAQLRHEFAKVGQRDIKFWGIAGKALREQGVIAIANTEDIAVMAFAEVFPKYLLIQNIFEKLLQEVEKKQPIAIICVDYPGMNLKFAKDCYIRGHTVIYHIAPKVWAHGWNRVNILRDYTQLVTCILPFEEVLFKQAKVCAKYIGNPLFDTSQKFISLNKNKAWPEGLHIGLIPGSRRFEIKKMIPLFVESLALLQKQMSAEVIGVLPVASTVPLDFVEEVLMQSAKKLKLPGNWVEKNIKVGKYSFYETLSFVKYAWVCSGTATLEAAFFNVPMAVVYKMNLLSAIISKMVIRTPFVSLVNLCANREIVPEFLQFQATPNALVRHAFDILTQPDKRQECQNNLQKLQLLFPEHAAIRAGKYMYKTMLTNMVNSETKYKMHANYINTSQEY